MIHSWEDAFFFLYKAFFSDNTNKHYSGRVSIYLLTEVLQGEQCFNRNNVIVKEANLKVNSIWFYLHVYLFTN